jgi:isoleucyl-tRNA synthetase
MQVGNYDFKEVEEGTLKFWDKNSIYQKAKDKCKDGQDYYFLDGPPYTSGKVHIGTAWNKSLKDMVLRYKRMAGFNVWDRAGYDMHGLPTAHAVEKKLGINGKEGIKKFGVAKFIEECKKLSVENMHVMNKDFTRLGVWMGFENAYQPISKEFIEGEWWLIKKAHENKRLYEGHRATSWCSSCSTALAKHELEYQTVSDDSIFMKFPVEGEQNTYLIIWTTTPWTIPFNMGVMVHPELDYVKCKVDNEVWILAKGLAGGVISFVANKKFEVIEEVKGKDLEGIKYIHPLHKEIAYFDEIKYECEKLHTVLLSSEYVDLTAGSGLVHTAPGCGPEDYEVGVRNGIPAFNNLDEKGVFPDTMGKFSGWTAKKDDKKFIKDFDERGSLVAVTQVEHEYAHCWRCKNPIIYKATKQWFFKVGDMKEKLIEENNKIKWVPKAAYNAFNSWLENLRDNSITKQRYWGTPLPVWRCDDCDNYIVVGDVAELEKLSGQKVEKLHKPWIDEITIKCDCGGVKKRIPDILDVWVDAGCTSWICLDYPHKEENFKRLFPPDFILEGKDQIRGWFNLLHVASMISMEKPSFRNVYMHGFVQDSQGRKMSKSIGNYILPQEVVDKYGADTLRYYMIGGANPGIDINYNFDDCKLKYKNLGVYWNLHKFLIDLAKNNGLKFTGIDKNCLEQEEEYMISKLHSGIKEVTELMEGYKINEVPLKVEEIFMELSRTYIQLVREKASIGLDDQKQVVFNVIFETFLESLKMFAIVSPFIAERMYQDLKEQFDLKEESIHLFDWPKFDEKMIDSALEKEFSIAKDTIQSILAARERAQLGVRWPVGKIRIIVTDNDTIEAITKLEETIKKQTNVKHIELADKCTEVKIKMKPNHRTIGQEYAELVPKIITRLIQVADEKILADVEKGAHTVVLDGHKVSLKKEHFIIEKVLPENLVEGDYRHGQLFLDKTRTPDLDAEGYSREVMRRVQVFRKKLGLEKKDNIKLHLQTSQSFVDMLIKWQDDIKDKCGAVEIFVGSEADTLQECSKEKIKKMEVLISCEKV